jgi:hypothetical protein
MCVASRLQHSPRTQNEDDIRILDRCQAVRYDNHSTPPCLSFYGLLNKLL